MQWPGDAAGYAGCESNGLPGCGLPNWVAEQPVKHKEQRWCTSKTTFSVIFKVQFHLSGPVLHRRGRGVICEFGLCRVCLFLEALSFRRLSLGQYQFRMKALAGELPGVQKASW